MPGTETIFINNLPIHILTHGKYQHSIFLPMGGINSPIMLDSRKRFTKTATVYDESRPSYPPALVDWVFKTSKLKGGSLVDIGCGTGISTRIFLSKGFKVLGIDPNEKMLEVARKRDGNYYQKGEAVKTGLPSKSVDIIVCAQAMHWFDLKPTFKEFRRILKPGGRCFAFWNIRKVTEFSKEYAMLIDKYSSEYFKIPKAVEIINKILKLKEIKSPAKGEFSNSQKLTLKGLVDRAFSSSYIAHGVKDVSGFKSELKELFARHGKNGHVTFYYKTVAISWTFV